MQTRRMMQPAARRKFRRRLLAWYRTEARELPWRCERNPYRIWVSEVMLQQTRVNAVREYYARFLEQFPTVEELARADEAAVLATWSGLGYYRRARALHAAAREIVARGWFPHCSAELRSLPGIGRYTAAAIASIAFGELSPVVDGNVERVLSRIMGTPEVDTWKLAGELLSRTRPGDFNQAMMELGATVCLPRTPECMRCPVSEFCATRGELAAAPAAVRKRKTVSYRLHMSGERIWLLLRPKDASLMPGMWELPRAESENGHKPELELRHSITNTDYRVRVYMGDGAERPKLGGERWVEVAEVHTLPLTGLTRKILRRLAII